MIYFDNAATSYPKPDSVARAVYNAINTLGNSGRGAYDLSLNAARSLFETRKKAAAIFDGDDPMRVALTSGATLALNLAIQGVITQSDHVITTVLEHNSVLRPLYKTGCDITFLPLGDDFSIDPAAAEKELRGNTKAIVVSHASNVTGDIVDISALGDICARHGLIFIVDCAQTGGMIPVSMIESNIDILCFSGHKGLMGPQGTGGIILREGIHITPLICGGSGSQSESKTQPETMPDLLEAGTANSHSAAGLLAGMEHVTNLGIENIYKKEQALLWRFYEGIKTIDSIRIYGNFGGRKRVPNIAFNLGDIDSAAVCQELWDGCEIAVRAGSHCAPLLHEALGTRGQGAVRLSFSHGNSEDEVDAAIKAIRKIAKML